MFSVNSWGLIQTKSAKTSERNIFFCKRHRSFILLAIVVVTSVLSFCSVWVLQYYELDNAMFNNSLPPSLRPRQSKPVTAICPCLLLHLPTASSWKLFTLKFLPQFFKNFPLLLQPSKQLVFAKQFSTKFWAASSFCILNLNHLQTGLYLHLNFFFTNLSLQAIFHILTFAAPPSCLAGPIFAPN